MRTRATAKSVLMKVERDEKEDNGNNADEGTKRTRVRTETRPRTEKKRRCDENGAEEKSDRKHNKKET